MQGSLKKILVVDDDNFILEIVSLALMEKGDYAVKKAHNGQEALDYMKQENFDLVITDIIMPEIDGIKFIDEIRKENKNIPVIVMSGGDDGGEVDQYINFAGYFANETLTKPFSKDDLHHAVSLVIDNKDPEVFQLFY